MRGRNGFLCWMLAALLLLALSALIEAPANSMAEALPEPGGLRHMALLPYTEPAQGRLAAALSALRPVRESLASGLAVCALALLPLLCRDANGHWICKKRYVDSVYLVFRQEAACG